MKTENKNIIKIEELNENLSNIKAVIKEAEHNYMLQIKDAVKEILQNKCKMILISGPSGSGKTTSSNLLSEELLKHNIGSLVISIDDFFIDLKDTPLLEDGKPDFENVNCVDIKAFNKFCNNLIKKQKAKMPKYDFMLQKRGGYEQVKISKDDVLIVEGIHALNPILLKKSKLTNLIYKLYVCVDSVYSYKNKILITERDLRLLRRTHRDNYTRNWTPEGTFQQWKHVCDGEDKYITPYKQYASKIINTTHNYELMVFAKYIPELLAPYKSNSVIKSILTKLSKVEAIDKKFVPKKSLLWEFLVNKE